LPRPEFEDARGVERFRGVLLEARGGELLRGVLLDARGVGVAVRALPARPAGTSRFRSVRGAALGREVVVGVERGAVVVRVRVGEEARVGEEVRVGVFSIAARHTKPRTMLSRLP
jgi:hypothetical protein